MTGEQRAAGHLEPGGRHAELAGHEVHRDRRQLARMPRESALDLEELFTISAKLNRLPPARRKAPTDTAGGRTFRVAGNPFTSMDFSSKLYERQRSQSMSVALGREKVPP